MCVATLVSLVIMYAHAQAAYGVRVPRWLLALTFVADNSIADAPFALYLSLWQQTQMRDFRRNKKACRDFVGI